MADNTKIEWTDATWNPITGCSVVSAGCKHCYAMKLAGTRLQHHPSRAGLTVATKNGPVWTGEVRFNEQWLDQPLRWSKPRMVFVCAHADLFHEAVPDEWIDKVFAVMVMAPQHTFQVLTKRAARMHNYMASSRIVLPNVWIGVSIEDQAAADERIPLLLDTPAAVRWISAEPLLGPVDLSYGFGIPTGAGNGSCPMHLAGIAPEGLLPLGKTHIHWVVVGGESGPGARPMHPEWARSLRDQCAEAGVPFLFKQWGEWAIASHENGHFDSDMARNSAYWVDRRGQMHKPSSIDLDNPIGMFRAGKKTAGRLLDGVQYDGYPEGRTRISRSTGQG